MSKWERGDRRPGPYYRARLCIALDATAEQLGLPSAPAVARSIRELTERREVPRRRSPSEPPLLDGLDRAARRLGHRRDTEPPSAVLTDLSDYLDLLFELLAHPQSGQLGQELREIAAFVAQNLAMACWIARDAATTYRTYAIAETLAREARSGSRLSLILVDRSEMAGQVAKSTGDWQAAKEMADAAETAALVDASTPPGVLAWIYGERSGHRAQLGEEAGSARDLERMEGVRLTSPPKALNVFSPALGGEWIDNYRVRRALRLGRGREAVELCARMLRETDSKLIWQHAETAVLLAQAWLLLGDLDGCAEQLASVIPLLESTGNGRDLTAVRRTVADVRNRWPRARETRRLEGLLRSG